MNILIISNFFPPHKGGLETTAFYTAKKLTEFGHRVIVLTSKCAGEKRSFHKLGDILIYRFKSRNLPELKKLPKSSNFGIMLKALLKFPKIIKLHNIQIIHAQGHVFPITFFSFILNQLIFKRPMFISIQGRLKIGLIGIIENIFDNIITKHLYKKSKKIICASMSLKERLLRFKINKKKFIVIPNGVDIHIFTKQKQSKFLNQYLIGKNGYKRIIFVGRLDKQKGVEYLLRAIPRVIEAYENVHFFILGNGILEKELKLLANKLKILSHTTFLDEVPLEKLPSFYSSADIFCLPSIYEGFPVTIAEALSCGLVIVASQTEGIPEAIIENKNGFLVKPKNISQLAYKLIKALNLNDKQVEMIRNNNINLAKNRYSWDLIVKKILGLYEEALN